MKSSFQLCWSVDWIKRYWNVVWFIPHEVDTYTKTARTVNWCEHAHVATDKSSKRHGQVTKYAVHIHRTASRKMFENKISCIRMRCALRTHFVDCIFVCINKMYDWIGLWIWLNEMRRSSFCCAIEIEIQNFVHRDAQVSVRVRIDGDGDEPTWP